jgi:hypothetical protein
MVTDFSNICDILGKLYLQYKDDDAFQDFIEYSDIGLPLAYLTSEDLCEVSEDGKRYIVESWDLFLAALEISDTGFTTLEEVLHTAGNKGLDN